MIISYLINYIRLSTEKDLIYIIYYIIYLNSYESSTKY